MPIPHRFETLIEDAPGAAWQGLFERLWPAYRAWYLRGAAGVQPTFLECRRALRQHMPELVPVWERLVELAGGGDLQARFLSMWCPPPYIAGCAQAVWFDPAGAQEPALVRNYDFAPALLEGSWLATCWRGPRVVALGDCLWGVLDGMNEAGLAVSLSFGGRSEHGAGFGVPLVLRYLLEVAAASTEAVRLLQRLPSSMTYSITLLDRGGDWATVFVAPDRPTEVTRRPAVTNVQHHIEWPAHERATRAGERLACLQREIVRAGSADALAEALLKPPLFQRDYRRGYGTLYTAVYRPASGRIELLWPDQRWPQTLDGFTAGRREIGYRPGDDGKDAA
jgi:predicted choloylglycine hydrolase